MSEFIPNPETQKLVIAISQGDERAFESLYQFFSEKIYHASRKMNLSHEDAEGVVQEAFLKIWKNRSKLDPKLSINAYLIAIVRSLIIKGVKKQARLFAYQQYSLPLLQHFSTSGPEEELIFTEFDQITTDIINQLPDGQRNIFRLRYLENLTVAEIAEQLNLSKRTVENQIFRATHTVKEKMVKLKIISSSILLFAVDTLLIRLIG